MAVPVVSTLNQKQRVTVELVPGMDPNHPQVEIRYENVPGGWVVVVQMLHVALGAALPHSFAQITQQSKEQEGEKRFVIVPGMNDLRH